MRVLCKCTGASDWECICYSKYISDDGTGGPGGPGGPLTSQYL